MSKHFTVIVQHQRLVHTTDIGKGAARYCGWLMPSLNKKGSFCPGPTLKGASGFTSSLEHFLKLLLAVRSGVATYWLMWLKPRAAGWWGRQNVMIFLF